jgi:AraC-like DNA-binding protein
MPSRELPRGAADADPRTSVRIYYPAEPLLPFVTFYYFVDVFAPIEDFLYPEWGNVRFAVSGEWRIALRDTYPQGPVGAALFGPTDHAARIACARGTTAGFGLTPLGWERLIGTSAAASANRVEPADGLFPMSPREMVAALRSDADDLAGVARFDCLLLERLENQPPNPSISLRIDAALRQRPERVSAFAELAEMSPRSLERACLRLFGFAPKRLLRRERFLDTLGDIRVTVGPRFTRIIGPGFVDQAHFTREFRSFMGLTPTEYIASPRPIMGPAAALQRAIGIPLSFRLPPQPG